MRKVVCTLASGPQTELLELAREPLEDFAARHGYDVVVETELRAPDRPASWSKVPLLRELLEGYDLALWVDADAIFVDTSRDIVEELEDDRFLYLAQHRYEGQDAANCGILLLRSCAEAGAFLDDVWAADAFVDHPWWEQAAILTMLGYRINGHRYPFARIVGPTPLFTRTKLLTHEWNSIARDPAQRPRITHYAGLAHDVRVAGMRANLAEFRRRREAERSPRRYAHSIVLPLGLLGGGVFALVEHIALLPDDLRYEVVFVDDGSGRFDELLAAVAGDVCVVTSVGDLASGIDAAVSVAGGETIVVLGAPVPLDAAWLEEIADATARVDAFSAVRAGTANAVTTATAWAIRHTDLVAAGGCSALAPGATTVADLFAALGASGRTPVVAGFDILLETQLGPRRADDSD